MIYLLSHQIALVLAVVSNTKHDSTFIAIIAVIIIITHDHGMCPARPPNT